MVSLRISNLTHEFDEREVFRSINCAFDGACLAVVGPNGSGKSTLLKILAGLLTPTQGEVAIELDGNPVPHGAIHDIVGLAAPDARLYSELSPRENLRFLMNARGSRPGDGLEAILEDVGLAGRCDDPVGELSSGLRQRACLAAALVSNPRLLLLDEPSAGLDEDGVAMLARLIENYLGRGMVVLATNDPDEARFGAARLDLGRAQ